MECQSMTRQTDMLDPLPITRIEIAEKGKRPSSGWLQCEIDRDIKFNTTELASYCFSNWEPIVFDALLLAAAVDFCDRVARRPALGWGRQFELRLSVHDPDRWKGHVYEGLNELLSFLTGDRWNIEFRPRKSPASAPPQGNFEIPDPSAAVLPFSEGLDSRITSALLENERKTRLIRVKLGSGAIRHTTTLKKNQPFAAVPYTVNQKRHRFVESSARSRGFKFAMLSGVAAYLSKASEIIVPESGQGALGPSLVPVGQAYEDYRNHPRFTGKMAVFLSALFGNKVRYHFPRIWQTKGQTLKEYIELTGDSWTDTRSCWQQNRQASVNGIRRQCGICAACILRRLSVHAAGQSETRETYVWENLSAMTFEEGAAVGFSQMTEALRQYAIAGTLHMEHLAGLTFTTAGTSSIRRNAFQISTELGMSPVDAEKKLTQMLIQHRNEWNSLLGSLGPNSFMHEWIVRQQ